MDTLLSMRVFCQVVQSGSFTHAANLLDISIPMASKHVAHLEKTIGAQLLYRNNRHLKLTEQGEQYYRECLHALEILAHAAEHAQAGRSTPQGILRISVPVWFACDHFARLIKAYQDEYPDVEVMITLTNRSVNLNSDGEDLALRLSDTLTDNIVAKPLGHIPFYLVATPEYLAKYGTPIRPEDLRQHQAVLPSYVDISALESEYLGQKTILELQGKLRSNNTQMLASLIRANAGIGYMPAWLANEDIRAGSLIHLLPEYQVLNPPLYAVYVKRPFMKAKIRSFIDFMAQYCANK